MAAILKHRFPLIQGYYSLTSHLKTVIITHLKVICLSLSLQSLQKVRYSYRKADSAGSERSVLSSNYSTMLNVTRCYQRIMKKALKLIHSGNEVSSTTW